MALTKFEVVFTKERILSASGLAIVGQMLGKSDFVKRVNRIPVNPKRSEPQIKDGDILLTYIGLLCQGKTEYEAVKEMLDDADYYVSALGLTRAVPSAETLRQRMRLHFRTFAVRLSICHILSSGISSHMLKKLIIIHFYSFLISCSMRMVSVKPSAREYRPFHPSCLSF